MPRELHTGRADRAGGAVYEDSLPLLDAGTPEPSERQEEPIRDRRCLLERPVGRHVHDRPALVNAKVFRVRARPETEVGAGADPAIAAPDFVYGRPDRLNLAAQ